MGTLALTLELAIQKSIFESRKFCHETLHYKLILTGITFSPMFFLSEINFCNIAAEIVAKIWAHWETIYRLSYAPFYKTNTLKILQATGFEPVPLSRLPPTFIKRNAYSMRIEPATFGT